MGSLQLMQDLTGKQSITLYYILPTGHGITAYILRGAAFDPEVQYVLIYKNI